MIASSNLTDGATWLYRTGQKFIIAAVMGFAMHGAHGTTPAAVVAKADTPASDSAMKTAMEHYRQGKFSTAYGQFSKLADQGNAEAARIALIMLRHGRKMHGTEWGASQPQIDVWIRLASEPTEPIKSESGD